MNELVYLEKEFDITMKRVDMLFESALSNSIISLFESEELFEEATSNSLATGFGKIIKTLIEMIKKFFEGIKNKIVTAVNKQKMKMKLASLKARVQGNIKVDFVDMSSARSFFNSFLKEVDSLAAKIKSSSSDGIDDLANKFDSLIEMYQKKFNEFKHDNLNESVGSVKSSKKMFNVAIKEVEHEIDTLDSILDETQKNAEGSLSKIDASVNGETEIKKVSLLKRISSELARETKLMGSWIANHPKTIIACIAASVALHAGARALSDAMEPTYLDDFDDEFDKQSEDNKKKTKDKMNEEYEDHVKKLKEQQQKRDDDFKKRRDAINAEVNDRFNAIRKENDDKVAAHLKEQRDKLDREHKKKMDEIQKQIDDDAEKHYKEVEKIIGRPVKR